ncbi:5'-nucleotidase, lipoprotein e(P4) family [Alteribacillus bidgolensis]
MNKKIVKTILGFAIIVNGLAACSVNNDTSETIDTKPVEQTTTENEAPLEEQLTMSLVWYQTSGENKSLYLQGYNIGKTMLDKKLAAGTEKKPAIILDIDETVLDNSPYNAYLASSGDVYPNHWDEWVNKAEAEPLPGSLDFLNYVDSKGVDIFYISNRRVEQMDATIKNLQNKGFPQVKDSHILLESDTSSKENRRESVLAEHEVLLLFGDNLNDFSDLFEEKNVKERLDTVQDLRAEFGNKFIVFPNPMYGDWEGAVYEYDWEKTDEEKKKDRKESLNVFKP